jgi:AbrB family looped-hinge helix DNA binding protein
MAQIAQNSHHEEWLKVLGKGMITLPKKWRDEMGIENGDVVKAKKSGNTVVIEANPQGKSAVPYRVYTDEEIQEFLKEDRLSEDTTKRAQARLGKSSSPTE